MLEELFSLAGRVALVTGGNGGLGRAMALGLRAAGARVAVTGRDAAKNARVAEEFGSESGVLQVDVRSEQDVAAAVAGVVERFGHLDILVNNAGVVLSNEPVTEMPRAEWAARSGSWSSCPAPGAAGPKDSTRPAEAPHDRPAQIAI